MPIPMSLPRCEGSVAVITGAASGIGRGAALAFHRSGARLVLIDPDQAGLEDTRDMMHAHAAEQGQAQGAADVLCFARSVADEAAMQEVARSVHSQFGRCDVLVNNAGVLLRGPLMGEKAPAQWRQTLDVNLSGAFYVTRAFVPLLQEARGCIVNVASIHSLVAVNNSVAYTASKGGLKQLTQALALELAPLGIRVNAVAPGSIATPMTAVTHADPQARAAFLSKVPLGRQGEVDDVVHAIQFLASDLAAYITGVLLPVDGGYVAI